MDSTWQTVQKMEQSQANPTLSQLQKAAHALGKELVIGHILDVTVPSEESVRRTHPTLAI